MSLREGQRAICCCIWVKHGKIDGEKQPKMTGAGRRGTPTLRLSLATYMVGAQGHGYLIFLFIVQLLSVSIWLSNQGVHQHQEGHVE